MALKGMEHFLVLTDDVEQTKAFYCDALGMTAGFRPEMQFEGCWIYIGEVPVVHVAETRTYREWTKDRHLRMSSGENGTGTLDHVAFNATDFEATQARLERLGFDIRCNLLDEIGLRQIFLEDPNGLQIELNFRA